MTPLPTTIGEWTAILARHSPEAPKSAFWVLTRIRLGSRTPETLDQGLRDLRTLSTRAFEEIRDVTLEGRNLTLWFENDVAAVEFKLTHFDND